MIELICDRCYRTLQSERAYIFSAERSGVRLTEATCTPMDLPEFLSENRREASLIHHKKKILCPECCDELWKMIDETKPRKSIGL